VGGDVPDVRIGDHGVCIRDGDGQGFDVAEVIDHPSKYLSRITDRGYLVAEASSTDLDDAREATKLTIGGPGLGGLLAQAAGPVTGLLADAVSFAVSFCCLTAMQPPRDRRSGGPAAGGVLDGLRFSWRDPYLRAMTAFSSLANLALTGVDALLVVFLVRTVGLSSAAAGLVMASLGVGGVLGALVARPLGRRFGTARAMLIAVPGGQCFALLLPLADSGPRLAFASVAMVCAGCIIVIANVIFDSFMQTYVSPDILGRVTSATRAAGFAMMPVGVLLAGVLATALGVRAALWILTALIAASGLTFLLTPMRHLRDLPRRPAEDSVRLCT
jgi:predicted MFS family arabinose efflux permease